MANSSTTVQIVVGSSLVAFMVSPGCRRAKFLVEITMDVALFAHTIAVLISTATSSLPPGPDKP